MDYIQSYVLEEECFSVHHTDHRRSQIEQNQEELNRIEQKKNTNLSKKQNQQMYH